MFSGKESLLAVRDFLMKYRLTCRSLDIESVKWTAEECATMIKLLKAQEVSLIASTSCFILQKNGLQTNDLWIKNGELYGFYMKILVEEHFMDVLYEKGYPEIVHDDACSCGGSSNDDV